MEVRDYELGFQGVVNSAVFQQYLEHANHQFLRRMGFDTVALEDEGVSLVLTRIEMSYGLGVAGSAPGWRSPR